MGHPSTRSWRKAEGCLVALVASGVLTAGCADAGQQPRRAEPLPSTAAPSTAAPSATDSPRPAPSTTSAPGATVTTATPSPHRATGTITLGFAGDVHFAEVLAPRLSDPETALRPIRRALSQPDLMMVNLETAITERGVPFPKEFNFRAPASALDALDAAGVDVVTMANNHAADYGAVGLRDTLAAVRHSPLPVVGIGEDVSAAFAPYETSIGGTRVAVLAATTLPDETATHWAATRDEPGVAVALLPKPRLTAAVRAAKRHADVVVVYLHWGDENVACPYWRPIEHARALAAAGADVIVGSHAHVLLGAGWLGDSFVDYGLGNFVWYNQAHLETGIVTVTVRDGRVVANSLAPATIGPDGLPVLLTGSAKDQAVADWRALRACTNLTHRRGG